MKNYINTYMYLYVSPPAPYSHAPVSSQAMSEWHSQCHPLKYSSGFMRFLFVVV